ncbi:MAG TPA: RDD family protein [Candidatus Thermoplasmatota archaeon]|jgi:uncharacterized RDD family membrane protein YckC|nr:RDD family protein [Candidatus Thermoplasmatota archaeon]
MRLSSEAQGWLASKVQAIMARHHLSEPERAGVYYELMSHLHAAGERKAQEAGRDEVSVGDLQAAVLEMGGDEALAQAFVAPRAKPLVRGGVIKRTGAVVLDYIVVALAEVAIMFLLFITGLFIWPLRGFRGDPFFLFEAFFGYGGAPYAWFLLTFVLVLAYFTYFEGRDGRSLGKQVFGLRVLKADGAPITTREALIRNAVKVFPPLLFLDTLFLIVFFNDEKQRVSDRLAQTIVVEG